MRRHVRQAVLVVVLAAALLLACEHPDDSRAPTPPWGRLKVRDILLEPPRDWVKASQCAPDERQWRFTGLEADGVERLLVEIGLTDAQRAAAMRATTCNLEDGCRCRPPDDLTTGLAPATRDRLYRRLARWPENGFASAPFSLPVRYRDWWLKADGLTPALQALVARLVHERDGYVFFADMDIVCRAAKTDEERIAIVRTFWRLPSHMAWLRLDTTTDISQVASWWEQGQRRKSLSALLGSLVSRDEETLVDIVHLLPPVPRKLLNTYTSPGGPERDCGWTAANFLLANIDDRFLQPENVHTFLASTTPVAYRDRHFGDLLLFTTEDGSIAHVAVVLTHDLLLTKNGSTSFQPWRLSAVEDVQREYSWAPILRVKRPRPR